MGRGYSSVDNTWVCERCIRDEGLKKFVRSNRRSGSCSYCKRAVRVCTMNAVIEHVTWSIRLEWGDPDNEGVGYNSDEGGYLEDTYTIWDVLDYAELDCPESILETIAFAIHDTGWCHKDPYSLTLDQTLEYGWKGFCDFIIHTARFVFYRADNPCFDKDQHDEMNPVDILESIGRIVENLGRVSAIPAGQTFYRVRIVDKADSLAGASQLGSPPVEFATMPNRMSPVGISMFYAAFDEHTAISETYGPEADESKKAVCGEFVSVRGIRVVDLTGFNSIPSLFDPKQQRQRPYFRFMRDFVRDFTKPIERNDRAHADYVPTQVVTEYFRHIHRTGDGARIDGIIYPSSKTGQRAIVIFADSEACIDADVGLSEKALLRLQSVSDIELEGFLDF